MAPSSSPASPCRPVAIHGRAVGLSCLWAYVAIFLLLAGVAAGQTGQRPAAPGSGAAGKLASDSIPPARVQEYENLAVDWMRQYLRIDTSNPPGNEAKAVAFFKRILDAEGIENQAFEYLPGRGNIWARIPATVEPKKRALIMLNHMDVVTSDPSHWKVPPFSGEIVDGSIYGRGAQDMKSEGLAQLMVMVMLKREKTPLDRDVIFLATSDEEVDDTGTQWVIQKHRELLDNAEFLITEGGENPREDGKVKYIGVDVAEKSPFWLKVTAKGRPGHGSKPVEDSAPNRLVHALDRLNNFHTELKVLPIVDEFMREMAPFQTPAHARQFQNVRAALRDRHFRQLVQNDDSLNYMFRNTVSLTMLGGAKQTNVIPGEAWANLDVRLLPGDDPNAFLELMRRVVADPNVSVDPLKSDFHVANASPTNTELYAAIRRVMQRYYPGPPLVPRMTSGYTENQLFRLLGVVSYGFSPYTATAEEGSTEHGDNERIRVEEVKKGPCVLYDVVVELAGLKRGEVAKQ